MNDADRLFLSNRSIRLNNDPYVYGYVDEYLEPALFEDLSANFPDRNIFVNYDGIESDSLADRPAWKGPLKVFSSEAFWTDLNQRLDGRLPFHPGMPVRVTFKLSSLKRADWIQPHTDSPRKIASLILYFALSDWHPVYGGGTEIYEPKFRLLRKNWHSVDAPFEWMHKCDTITFVPNRLVLIVKSVNSWHGVSPITCPEGAARNTLLVTLQHADDVENVIQRSVFRFLRRQSVRLIRARM